MSEKDQGPEGDPSLGTLQRYGSALLKERILKVASCLVLLLGLVVVLIIVLLMMTAAINW